MNTYNTAFLYLCKKLGTSKDYVGHTVITSRSNKENDLTRQMRLLLTQYSLGQAPKEELKQLLINNKITNNGNIL